MRHPLRIEFTNNGFKSSVIVILFTGLALYVCVCVCVCVSRNRDVNQWTMKKEGICHRKWGGAQHRRKDTEGPVSQKRRRERFRTGLAVRKGTPVEEDMKCRLLDTEIQR